MRIYISSLDVQIVRYTGMCMLMAAGDDEQVQSVSHEKRLDVYVPTLVGLRLSLFEFTVSLRLQVLEEHLS